jgi:hypothetical protein
MPQAIKTFTSSALLFAGSLAARFVSRFLFGEILSGKNRVELGVLVVALRGELKRSASRGFDCLIMLEVSCGARGGDRILAGVIFRSLTRL